MASIVAECDERIIKVQGAARCGKTQALIDRCCTLLGRGVEPAKILLVASTGMAAQALKDRLVKCADEELASAAKGVDVLTPAELCGKVFENPAAQEFTGRSNRVLNRAEYKFLQEDLRVLGASNRKVKSALSYYLNQMGKLVPRSEWVLLGEEHTIIKYLEETLKAREAVLPQELAALTVAFLTAQEGKDARHAYDYVLCDDFQNLNYAEQSCVCICAGDQLVVAGNANQTVAREDIEPNPEGFTAFETKREGVKVFELNEPFGNANVAKMANALVSHGDMNAAFGAQVADDEDAEPVTVVKWVTPEKELDALTKYLRLELDKEDDLRECRTSVVVPNARWAHFVTKVLKQRGFNVTSIGIGNTLGGDPRDTERCKAQIAYTKLCLLADPKDTVAWRSCLGFGNFLTNSDLWAHLQEGAKEKGLSMLEALEELAASATDPFPKAYALRDAYKQMLEFIEKNAKRKGFALMKAVGADQLPEFSDIMEQIAGDETAEQALAICRKGFSSPCFPENQHLIRVMLPQNMTGLEADNIYVFACIDGFYPPRDAYEVVSTDEARDKIMNDWRRMFYSAISKANKRLVVSFFSQADLEIAEKSKMQVVRVKSADGETRTALLRMSQFLKESGSAYPGTTSGQQLLAQYGLD